MRLRQDKLLFGASHAKSRILEKLVELSPPLGCSLADLADRQIWDAYRDADPPNLSRWDFQGAQKGFAFSSHVSSSICESVQCHTPTHIVTGTMT